jgi:hypothetical protein
MRTPRQAVATGVATTLALVVVLVALPGERALALDAWFLAIGALAVGATLRATVGRLPVEPPSPIDEPPPVRPDERPADLEELETAVQLGAESDFDLYFRLRPRLRRIAEAKLRARGIELDAPDGAAAEALGPAAWELLRPDRPRPQSTSRARNLPAIAAVVDALERL